MKKHFVIILAVFLMISTFSDCSDAKTKNNKSAGNLVPTSSSENTTGTVSGQESKKQDDDENVIVYSGYNAADSREFQEALYNNPIDKSYNKEENDGTTVGMRSYYTKYIEIWKTEMEKSADLLCTFMDENEKELFLNAQEDFENSVKENMDVAYDLLFKNGRWDFHIRWLMNYLEKYRERTFELKWISYNLECEKGNKPYDSLSFHCKNKTE